MVYICFTHLASPPGTEGTALPALRLLRYWTTLGVLMDFKYRTVTLFLDRCRISKKGMRSEYRG